MPDLERQMLIQADHMQTIAYYEALRRSGVGQDEALQSVKRTQVRFAEFLDNNDDPADIHVFLPIELKARVIQFIERQAATDPSGSLWSKKVADAGSANAAIRNEIREGNL